MSPIKLRENIWAANIMLLRHEQEVVVQPMFDRLGAVFKKVITFCATLDFSPNHLKTDPYFHSSFIFYMYRRELKLLFSSGVFPELTLFPQRWSWLSNKVAQNWRAKEESDPSLFDKLKTILNTKGC